jgi:hypothetical protein
MLMAVVRVRTRRSGGEKMLNGVTPGGVLFRHIWGADCGVTMAAPALKITVW